MRPSTILAVLSDIVIYARESVVECGSGNSTLYVARLLREREQGHIVTIDHDAAWAGLTRRLLESEGLDDWATVVLAPLNGGWYDVAALPTITSIDLLVVDGPPAFTRSAQYARAPALDHFASVLTPDSTVILDDARRRGERAVLAEWTRRHGRHFEVQRGGYGVSAPHIGSAAAADLSHSAFPSNP
jgi:predicted O-methyltransferase YrrM